MRSEWRRDGGVCRPGVVEGMQVNTGIGVVEGVGLLRFEDLFRSGSMRRLEWCECRGAMARKSDRAGS